MSRKYLEIHEASAALGLGKTVEVFLGGFIHRSQKCIRWASFEAKGNSVLGFVWEAYDQGSLDYADVYSFEPVSGEYDKPVRNAVAGSICEAAAMLGVVELKLVNQGIVQDEYLSYNTKNT